MNQMTEVINLRAPHSRTRSQYDVEFDPSTGTIWGYFNTKGTPCFSLGLLSDIRAHDSTLEANHGYVLHEGEMHKVHYYVAGSRTPGVFNLGGDLALFVLLIKSRDREALTRYASLCIDNVYPRIQNYFCSTLTTISMIQGDALGGGFETALTSDIIVAEKSANMGLPEILFNLFPGMGAFSMLARRIGLKAAEDLILSGRILDAAKLHEMGIVDVLAEDGGGERAVQEWIRINQKRRNGFQAVIRSRQHVHPIEREELDKVAETWVDAALRLEDKDIKMMSRIVRSQMRRMGDEPAESINLADRVAASA